MTDLEKNLSDLSSNSVSANEIEKIFDEIAVSLLRQTKLIAGDAQYLIREIEFYFCSGYYNNHKDPYIHSSQYNTVRRQEEFGEWYFHRYKSSETYLKQKFRGLDITVGNKELGNFGGILIRKIQHKGSDQVISGISNIVGEIISKIGEAELNKLATQKGKFVLDTNSKLHLTINGESQYKPMFKTTREIPNPKNEEEQKYYTKPYRYFNYPEIIPVRS